MNVFQGYKSIRLCLSIVVVVWNIPRPNDECEVHCEVRTCSVQPGRGILGVMAPKARPLEVHQWLSFTEFKHHFHSREHFTEEVSRHWREVLRDDDIPKRPSKSDGIMVLIKTGETFVKRARTNVTINLNNGRHA